MPTVNQTPQEIYGRLHELYGHDDVLMDRIFDWLEDRSRGSQAIGDHEVVVKINDLEPWQAKQVADLMAEPDATAQLPVVTDSHGRSSERRSLPPGVSDSFSAVRRRDDQDYVEYDDEPQPRGGKPSSRDALLEKALDVALTGGRRRRRVPLGCIAVVAILGTLGTGAAYFVGDVMGLWPGGWPHVKVGIQGSTKSQDLSPRVYDAVKGVKLPVLAQSNYSVSKVTKTSGQACVFVCVHIPGATTSRRIEGVGTAGATVAMGDIKPADVKVTTLTTPTAGKPGSVKIVINLPVPKGPQSVDDVSVRASTIKVTDDNGLLHGLAPKSPDKIKLVNELTELAYKKAKADKRLAPAAEQEATKQLFAPMDGALAGVHFDIKEFVVHWSDGKTTYLEQAPTDLPSGAAPVRPDDTTSPTPSPSGKASPSSSATVANADYRR